MTGDFPTIKKIATQFRIISDIDLTPGKNSELDFPALGFGSLTFGHDFDFEN